MPDKGDIVGDEEWLYRRAYPTKQYTNPDGTATSRAFKLREKDNNALSVDVKSMTTPEASVVDKAKYCLFEISHVEVKTCGVQATHDPNEELQNLAHSIITGPNFNILDDVTPGQLARKSFRVYLA